MGFTTRRYCRTEAENGFTLIELMVVVAVIGILAAVAYPSYRDSVLKGRRAEARAALAEFMQQQERYMTQNNTYLVIPPTTTVMRTTVGNGSNVTYNLTADTTCPNGINDARTCIRGVATPVGSDPLVGALTLTSTGVKGCALASTDANFRQCWP